MRLIRSNSNLPVLRRGRKSRYSFFPNGISGGAWTPSRLTGSYVPLQWALDGGSAYESTTLDSYQPLRSLESYGTYRKPRKGRCGLFDGTDDYGTLGARLTSGTVSTLTVSVWVKTTDTTHGIAGEYNTTGNQRGWLFYINSGVPTFIASADGTDTPLRAASTTVNDGAWHHIAAVFSAGTINLYIDGTLSNGSVTGTIPAAIFSSTAQFLVATYSATGGGYYAGSMRDLRVYTSAKTGTEILAIKNQASTPTTFDTTGLLGGWRLNEEAGLTAYDWSGNGKHLTLTNITTSTFHASDTGVGYNPANWLGFTLSGSTVIPRNEASTANDVTGSALAYTGKCPHPAVVETPCITGDGTSVGVVLGSGWLPASTADWTEELWLYHSSNGSTIQRIINNSNAGDTDFVTVFADCSSTGTYSAGSLCMLVTGGGSGAGYTAVAGALTSGAWHRIVLSRSGSTFTATAYKTDGSSKSVTNTRSTALPTMYTGLIGNYGSGSGVGNASSGRVASFSITTGGVTTYFPLQEGPGSSNTNRDLYYVKSDGTYGKIAGAIVNGTVSNIWSNRCPGYVQDWCVNYGGRLTTENLFKYSEQFDNAAWTKTGTTITANAAVAPNGTTTMDKWVEDTSGAHVVRQSINATSGTLYRFRIYAKAAENSYIALFTNSTNKGQMFNLATGAAAGVIGSAPDSVSITAVGNGIYLCEIAFTASSTAAHALDIYSSKDGVNWDYTGDGTSGIYIWGAHVYAGAAQSYQPTTSAAVDANRFIPGLISGTVAADGLTKTLTAGKHGNPYSRFSPNPWAAPEMRAIGHTTSTLYAPAADEQSVSPADTKFRRTASDGDDRFIAVATALTGTDKTNMEAYVT